MNVCRGLLLALVSVLAGCAVDSSPLDERTGSRTTKSLTIPLHRKAPEGLFCSWGALNGFKDIDSKEFRCEDGLGGVSSESGPGGKLTLYLVLLPTGDDAVMVSVDKAYGGYSYVLFAERRQWGRLQPSGEFIPFEDSYQCTFIEKNPTWTTISWGADEGGKSDYIFSVRWNGGSLSASLGKLHRLRFQEVVQRAQKRGYYKGLVDSEGYAYVASMRQGNYYQVQLWNPYWFEPEALKKTQDPRFDFKTLRPLAALEFLWDKENNVVNTVDMSAIRKRVYGVGGGSDPCYMTYRKMGEGYDTAGLWFAGGDPQTNFRKGVEHERRAATFLAEGTEAGRAKAVEEYTQALSFEPTSAYSYYGRAKAVRESAAVESMAKKTREGFIRDVNKVLELDPGRFQTVEVLGWRAQIRDYEKDFAGADADYTECIRLQKPENYWEVRNLLAARKEIRRKMGNAAGAEADDAEIARREAERKANEERQHQEAVRKAETERYSAPGRVLVEAGIAKWNSDTSTYTTMVPPYDRKLALLERRLKDVGEKQLVIHLLGNNALYGSGTLERLGFKLLKEAKIDTETRINFIISCSSDSLAELKNGQGRTLETCSGNQPMDRVYNHLMMLYLKNKMDWESEKYAELGGYWEKYYQKEREKDPEGLLEALEQILKLDPEDKVAITGKLNLQEEAKDWKGMVKDCTKLLDRTPADKELRKRRLKAATEIKDVDTAATDLTFLTENTTYDWEKTNYMRERAKLLMDATRYKEAAEAWNILVNRTPNDTDFLETWAWCLEKTGETSSSGGARAKALELKRQRSPDFVTAHAGIARWKENTVEAVLEPATRARFEMVQSRLVDPQEPKIRIYFRGPADLGGAIEKAGFEIDIESGSGTQLRLEVPAGRPEWILSNPAGEILVRVPSALSTYTVSSHVPRAIAALAAAGKISILPPVYEPLIALHEKLVEAVGVGDEAEELALRARMAEAAPQKTFIQQEYLATLVRFKEYDKAVRMADRPEFAQSEKATDSLVTAFENLGMVQEQQSALERLARLNSSSGYRIVNFHVERGRFRQAAEIKAAEAAAKQAKASGDYDLTSVSNALYEHGDLLKRDGNVAGAGDAYRKAANLKYKDFYHYFADRAKAKASRGDIAGAMADLNGAIQSLGDKATAPYFIARAEIRVLRGDLEGALNDYSSALKSSPTEELYLGRAKVYEKLGKKADAAEDLKRAYALPLSSSWYYYYRGSRRAALGDYEGALLDQTKAVETAANDSELAGRLTERADTKTVVGDLSGAISDLDKAIELTPSPAERAGRLDKRAELKRAAGDQAGAAADLGEAIRAQETAARLFQRAKLFLFLNQPQRAADDIKWALSLPWKFSEYGTLVWRLQELGEMKLALEIYDRTIPHLCNAGQGTALIGRAALKDAMGNVEGAEKDRDAAVQTFDSFDSRSSRAWQKHRKGDLEGALADLAAAVARPGSRSSLVYRAQTRFGLGDEAGAFQDLDAAAKHFPLRSDILARKASLLETQGKPDEALKEAEAALELSKGDAEGLKVSCRILISRGRKEEAFKRIQEALTTATAWQVNSLWEVQWDAFVLAKAFDEALELCRTAALPSKSPQIWRTRAVKTLLAAGRKEDALAKADEAVKADARDSEAVRLRASTLIALGKKDEAISFVKERAASFATPDAAWAALAVVAGEANNPDATLQALEKCNFGFRRSWDGLVLLARAQLAKGDKKQALDALQKARILTMGAEGKKKIEELEKLVKE